ncbi:septum formation initiator family protein [Streptomyces sp. NPDC086077]|uniref:FtsB family cell division protein n=1 Tax=Streptomyces sp. NPDC086077 TaxID=3154862 RepID=UPI00343C2E6C
MSRKPELRGRAARLAQLLPTGRGQAARTPFVLLVVLLLGGGLIGLLVLNSALSEGSFQLDDLQKETKNLTDEEQALQRDIDAYSAPDALQRRARELGMVPGSDPAFLDPDGTVKGVPSAVAAEPASARHPLVLAPEAMATGPAPALSGSPAAVATPFVPTAAATPTPTAPAPRTAPPAGTPAVPAPRTLVGTPAAPAPRTLTSTPAPLPTTPSGR